jgi:transcription elongation factor
MSEVSVSRRRRSPSARSALPLTRTLTRPWGSVTDAVEKARRIALAEELSSVKTCSVRRITYPNVSYLSQKVMSEVSVSRRRRSPSARSALPLTRTLTRPWGSVTDAVEKARRIASAEELSNMKTCSVRRITYPNVSYLSQKATSEVSVSRRRRSPSARSALAAYVYSVVFRIHFRSSQKSRKTFWQKRSFFEENLDAEGVPPF